MTELLPHVAAFLAGAPADPRPWSALTPAEARARNLASRQPDLTAPDVAARDVEIASADGTRFLVRVYGEGAEEHGVEPAAVRPVVVFLHGGGWVYGDLDMADGFCRRLCAAAAVTVCSVDYRLSPEHRFPAALEDTCAAVAWAHEHLSGGRPLAIVGSSAGGNLAIAACLVERDEGTRRIGLQVPMCAVTDHAFDSASYREFERDPFLSADDMRWYWAQYLADPADGANPLASVLRADLHELPPALVVTAERDPLRDEAEAYARRIVEAAGVATVSRYDGMLHAFPVIGAFPEEQARVIEEVAAAVAAHLR